jgi:hypothetical protein
MQRWSEGYTERPRTRRHREMTASPRESSRYFGSGPTVQQCSAWPSPGTLEDGERNRIIVIPKAGTPDYSKVRAYRVLCLLDVVSKLVEQKGGRLIADHLERKKGQHERQYGCPKRRSCIDAVAVLMNRTQAWGGKKIAGAIHGCQVGV